MEQKSRLDLRELQIRDLLKFSENFRLISENFKKIVDFLLKID